MTLVDSLSYFVARVAIAIAPQAIVLMLMVRAAGNDIKSATGLKACMVSPYMMNRSLTPVLVFGNGWMALA